MAGPRRSRSSTRTPAKSLKCVTAGGLEGIWNTKRRCMSLDLPVGVTSIKMVVEGVDGVHTMDFSSFECAGSFVPWKDYDYPWATNDFMLAREIRRQGRRLPTASSQAYPRRQDIVHFENPTQPPFLFGGQRPWRGRSYSPSELRYSPHPVSRPRRSQLVSPCHHCPTPVMGILMSCTRDRSASTSSSCSSGHTTPATPHPERPGTPSPVPVPDTPSPDGAFTPYGKLPLAPTPTKFYDFTGYRLEERSFLSSLCDEIGTVGELLSVAANIGFPYSRVQQILTSFPNDFPAAVFAVLAGWYTTSPSGFCVKMDDLEDAFKDLQKGALFHRIVKGHSAALRRASSVRHVRFLDCDTLDESLGEVVMIAVDVIPSCHLRLLRTLLLEVTDSSDLLTVTAACGINPVLIVAVTESRLHPSHKAARVFLPWYAQSDLLPKDKYLRLKFGFQCAGLLAVFNTILEDHRPEVVSSCLPATSEHLFRLSFAPSVCVSAEETRQMLNEWEFTFLTILCNAIFDERRISTVVPTLQVPIAILNDAALVHSLPAEQDALTAHILFEWWCSAPISLTEKLTHLQCAFTGIGLGPSYYTALKSYGHFLYHFSSPPVAQTSPPSPAQPPVALAGRGESVVVNRGFTVGPRVSTQVVLQQLEEEMYQDKENSAPCDAPTEDSGITADAPLTTAVTNRLVTPGPSTPMENIAPSKSQKAKNKNPFVKLIRL